MNREDALRKIRALLKTSGRSAAESDTAQILAAALAEKHGIDLEEAASDKPEAVPIVHKVIGEWASVPAEAKYASLICANFFDVTKLTLCKLGAEQIVLIGTAHHIEIAEYIFTFLKREFARMWTHRKGRSKKRTLFIWGSYLAVRQKLASRENATATEAANALVVSQTARRTKYIEDTWGETTSSSAAPKQTKGTAASKGFRAGLDINIRPGVAGGASPAGFLTRPPLALPPAP